MAREQELSILTYLIQNPNVYEGYNERIKEIYFRYEPAQLLYKIFESAFTKHQKFPNFAEFEFTLTQTHPDLSPFVRSKVMEDAGAIYTASPTGSTQEALLRYLIERESYTIGDILQSEDYVKIVEELPKIQQRIEKLQGLSSTALTDKSWFCPFRKEFIEDPLRFNEFFKGRPWVRTGIGRLDHRLQGGLKPGELSIIVGTTGAGKSLFMLHVALAALRDGHRVVYYALDNTEQEMVERIYANITGVPIQAQKEKEDFVERLKMVVKEEWADRFFLVEWPANSRTVRDVRRHLQDVERRCKKGDIARGIPEEKAGRIELVVVDYGDCLLAEQKFNEPRHSYGFTFQRLMGLAVETKASVLTGTQGNRVSLGRDVLTLESISEAYNKSWPAGLVMTFCQSYAEREMRQFRLAVVKARREQLNYCVPCKVDYGTMRVFDNTEVDVVPIRAKEKVLEGKKTPSSATEHLG